MQPAAVLDDATSEGIGISSMAAQCAIEGADEEDDKEAAQGLDQLWNDFLVTPEGQRIVKHAEEEAEKELKNGANPYRWCGKQMSRLFNGLKRMLNATKHIPGIFKSLCMVISVKILVELKAVSSAVADLKDLMMALWTNIKRTTGFVWEEFKAAFKNPVIWAGVTAAVAAVAAVIWGWPAGVVVGTVGAIATTVVVACQQEKGAYEQTGTTWDKALRIQQETGACEQTGTTWDYDSSRFVCGC